MNICALGVVPDKVREDMRQLLLREFPQLSQEGVRDSAGLTSYLESKFTPGGTRKHAMFVAMQGDELAGCVAVHCESDAYLCFLCTVPALRGRGVATALLTHALGHCRRWGFGIAMLTCEEQLVPFYQRRGFVPHGHAQMPCGTDVCLMYTVLSVT